MCHPIPLQEKTCSDSGSVSSCSLQLSNCSGFDSQPHRSEAAPFTEAQQAEQWFLNFVDQATLLGQLSQCRCTGTPPKRAQRPSRSQATESVFLTQGPGGFFFLIFSPNLYIETLSPDMTVFRARAFEEVRKVK